MSKSYFITGANGQLGRALATQYPLATVVDHTEFDITDPESYDTIDWALYDTLINAAAMTDVDGAETADGRKLAWAVNASAVALMAKTATIHGLTLVHVSSDYVFDGSVTPHAETEAYSPLGVYGQSKAAGDLAVSAAPKHYILRTSWVIGDGKNFISIMKNLADRDVKPSVVNDQIGRLTFVPTLVETIDHLLSSTAAHGTYNCSNNGDSVSWADIAKLVFEKAGKSANDVTPVSTEQYYEGNDGIAARPPQSTLDLSKIQSTGYEPSDWHEALDSYWKTLEEQS